MLTRLVAILFLCSPAFAAPPMPAEPGSYPDAEGLQRRSDAILAALAGNDLGQWRRGYFSGGDPGKYLPASAMARLLKNPADPEPARYMNDERSYREHYHFAAVNWARFVPLFGDKALTDDTRQKLRREAARYAAYLSPAGTENHRTMWMTSANVLPHVLDTGLAHKSKEQTLRQAKEMLREYVKGLYAAGQGEWDSSTYLMFDVNGLLNIYDFSPDEETRQIARAGLDWLVAGYALKYRDGVYCAPNQRGHAATPFTSIADRTGYVWFGDATRPPADMQTWHYTVHAITSKWRPGKAIYNLATRKLPTLPAEYRNTKPNYWYGQQIPHRLGEYAESLYVGKHYTMGSLWNGFGGQITRFQIVASTADGAVTFTGGHPRRSDHTGKRLDEFGYADGLGRYDQSAQVGGTYINLTHAPEDEPIDHVFFKLPPGIEPTKAGDWQVMRAGDVFLAVRGIGGEAVPGQTDLTTRQQEENRKATASGKPIKHVAAPILKVAGRQAGFIVETGETGQYPNQEAFIAALAKTKLDGSAADCRYTNLAGRAIEVTYQPGKGMAATRVDGKPVDRRSWEAIYDGPYLRATPGRLTVSDGVDGFTVDFTGDLPVYGNLKE